MVEANNKSWIIILVMIVFVTQVFSSLALGCTDNSECGTCQKWDSGNCVNEYGEDVKLDCRQDGITPPDTCGDHKADFGYNHFGYQYFSIKLLCDGNGGCNNIDIPPSTVYAVYNVDPGFVCYDGSDYYLPDAIANCAIWRDCVEGSTTADEYYTGFDGTGTPTCTDINWQPAETQWTAPAGHVISVTEHAAECQVVQTACSSNADCGLCQKCVSAACVNQGPNQDLKKECTASSICLNPWTIFKTLNSCDGNGACKTQTTTVAIGNVCYNGQNANPSANVNCGIWDNCFSGRISATQFWVGYNNGANCIDTGWVATGTNWSATPHYMISATEHAPTCQQTYMECLDNSECGPCKKCSNHKCINQGPAQDLKNDCNPSASCLNDWTIFKTLDNCDGNGACKTSTLNVNVGKVCAGGKNSPPTANEHCGPALLDCILGKTTAYQYYLGYQGDGTPACTSSGWVKTGFVFNTNKGNLISVTEKTVNNYCQQAPKRK